MDCGLKGTETWYFTHLPSREPIVTKIVYMDLLYWRVLRCAKFCDSGFTNDLFMVVQNLPASYQNSGDHYSSLHCRAAVVCYFRWASELNVMKICRFRWANHLNRPYSKNLSFQMAWLTEWRWGKTSGVKTFWIFNKVKTLFTLRTGKLKGQHFYRVIIFYSVKTFLHGNRDAVAEWLAYRFLDL